MLNKTTRWVLALVAVLTLAVPAISPVPDAAPAQTVAVEDRYGVRVNGVPMTQSPMVTHVEGTTYVSLRTMAVSLTPGASLAWDGRTATVTAPGVLDLTATPGESYIVANGRCLYVPHKVQARNGAVLLPLDVVCKALDATYIWQPDGSLDLTAGTGGILSGEQFYNADDLYWLSHIIHAESGNQPLAGKMAVGNVVLNRVADGRFPNSIYAVVFQKNQFTPARSGSIHRAPSAESILAAKLCLDGGEALDNVLWFNRAGLNSWASRNRTYVTTIAGHAFYA